jgi:hypothetical protein
LSRIAFCPIPDQNLPLNIYTDANNYQLVTLIIQQNTPVTYYSHKPEDTKKNYTSLEKERLRIYKTLYEFHSMLLGPAMTVDIDHKQLSYCTVVRQLNYLHQFTPRYEHIPGESNFLASIFSCLLICNSIIIPQKKESTDTAICSLAVLISLIVF